MVFAPYQKIHKIKEKDTLAEKILVARQKRNSLLKQIGDLKTEVCQVSEELARLQEPRDKKVLIVSGHAVERWKQRVSDIPSKKIRGILSSAALLNAYLKGGTGRYSIDAAPTVLVVIVDFVVKTVINKNEPEEKLRLLPLYLDYFVDQKIAEALGKPYTFMTFAKFRHAYYTNTK
jgi:hypothetical protein